jgi:hypothetical protein
LYCSAPRGDSSRCHSMTTAAVMGSSLSWSFQCCCWWAVVGSPFPGRGDRPGCFGSSCCWPADVPFHHFGSPPSSLEVSGRSWSWRLAEIFARHSSVSTMVVFLNVAHPVESQLVRLAHEQCSAGFFLPLSSQIILFILPAEHYSFYQPNTPSVVVAATKSIWFCKVKTWFASWWTDVRWRRWHHFPLEALSCMTFSHYLRWLWIVRHSMMCVRPWCPFILHVTAS